MSITLRSLVRDPRYVNPMARVLRRLEDEMYPEDWQLGHVDRRRYPVMDNYQTSAALVDAVSRMQDFAEEMDSLAGHLANQSSGESANNRLNRILTSGGEMIKRTGDGSFQLALDVADYKPEDIKIKLVNDHLVIEAKSESSGENSYHKSEFKKWFKLPADCKLDQVKSTLTKDNKLLVHLPSTKPAIENKTRDIPIDIEQPQAVEDKKSSPAQQQKGDQQVRAEK